MSNNKINLSIASHEICYATSEKPKTSFEVNDVVGLPDDLQPTSASDIPDWFLGAPRNTFQRPLFFKIADAMVMALLSPLAMGGCTAVDETVGKIHPANDTWNVDAGRTGDSDGLSADSDGDGKADMSVNPDTASVDGSEDSVKEDISLVDADEKDGLDTTSTPDSDDALVADSDGDGEADMSVNPDVIAVDGSEDSKKEDIALVDADEKDGLDATSTPDSDDALIADSDATVDGSQDAAIEDANDAAQQCTPKCVPVQNNFACDKGSSVKIEYSIECATLFACGSDSQVISKLDSMNVSTQVVCETLSVNCEAKNETLGTSTKCAPVPVIQNNLPPKVMLSNPSKNSDGTGVLPSGDQCFNKTNNITFEFEATDPNNDALTCGISVFSKGKIVSDMTATFAKGGKHTFLLPANSLQPKTDYSAIVDCDDKLGSGKVPSNTVSFTTSEKGLIGWWRFDEGQGNIAKDSSGNGVDGSLVNFDPTKAWVKTPTGVGIFFNGIDNYVTTKSPDSWNNLAAASIMISFKNAYPLNDNADLFDKVNDKNDSNRFTLEFLPNKALVFGSCATGVECKLGNIPQSKTTFTDTNWHTVLGTYNGFGANIYINGILENQISYKNPSPLITTTNFVIGSANLLAWRHYHGTIDDVALYNVDINNTCK